MPKPPPPTPAAGAAPARAVRPERARRARTSRPRASGRGRRGSAGPTPAPPTTPRASRRAGAAWPARAPGASATPRAGATRRPRPVRRPTPSAPPAGGTWEPEVWIDEGEVVQEAKGAVGRGRARRGAGAAVEEGEASRGPVAPQGDRRRPSSSAPTSGSRRPGKAFRRERYEEARKILRPIAEAAPTAVSVRELLGLTLYRLGRWKQAVTELEAFTDLTRQHRAAPGPGRLLPRARAATPG